MAAAALVEAEVEDLHDVRVHEPRGGERLAAEARDELLVVGEVLGEQLHGDVALEAPVEGLEHGRHAADAEAVAQLVALGQDLRRHQGVVVPPVVSRRAAGSWSSWSGSSSWSCVVVVSSASWSVGVVSVGVVSVGVVSVGVVSVGVVRRRRVVVDGVDVVVLPLTLLRRDLLQVVEPLAQARHQPVVDRAAAGSRGCRARGRRRCSAAWQSPVVDGSLDVGERARRGGRRCAAG